MKKIIEANYNLKITNLENINDIYYFFYNFEKYYFVPYKRPIEDLEDIYNIANELLLKKIPSHILILNNKNYLITNVNDKNYILFKILIDEKQELSLFDIIKIESKLKVENKKSKLYRNNWGKLWSEKIDYFEYQISRMGKERKIIANSFSYYIGLAENAIAYANETVNEIPADFNPILTLSHKRIFSPNYALNFFNPLSFIIDLNVRDIAEYIKYSFFNKELIWNEVESFLLKFPMDTYASRMLYARLLFPSYYFDCYEKIVNNEANEEELFNITDLVDDYEILLNKIYNILNKKNPIPKIDWIN